MATKYLNLLSNSDGTREGQCVLKQNIEAILPKRYMQI